MLAILRTRLPSGVSNSAMIRTRIGSVGLTPSALAVAWGAALLLGADPHRAALAIAVEPPLPYRLQLFVESAGKFKDEAAGVFTPQEVDEHWAAILKL